VILDVVGVITHVILACRLLRNPQQLYAQGPHVPTKTKLWTYQIHQSGRLREWLMSDALVSLTTRLKKIMLPIPEQFPDFPHHLLKISRQFHDIADLGKTRKQTPLKAMNTNGLHGT